MARHKKNLKEILRWNKESLDRADIVDDDMVKGFYPSLYLNMGSSYENLGNHAEAKRYYDLAFKRIGDLENDGYGNGVRGAIAEARERANKKG